MARTQRIRRSPAERVSAKAGAAARGQSPSARGGLGAKPAPAPGQAPGSSLPPAQAGIGSWAAPRPGQPGAAAPMGKGDVPISADPGATTGGNPVPAPRMKGPPPGALGADGAAPARGTRPRPRWVGAATGPRLMPGVREAPAGRAAVGGDGDAGAGPVDTDPSKPMRLGQPQAAPAPGSPVNFAPGLLAPWGAPGSKPWMPTVTGPMDGGKPWAPPGGRGDLPLNTHSGGANVPAGYGNAPPFGGASMPTGVGMPVGIDGGMMGGIGTPPTSGAIPGAPGGLTSSPRVPMQSPWGGSGGIMKPTGPAPGPRLRQAIESGQVSPEVARLALR